MNHSASSAETAAKAAAALVYIHLDRSRRRTEHSALHRLTAPQLDSTAAAFLKFNRHLLPICRFRSKSEDFQYFLQTISRGEENKSDFLKRSIDEESHLAFEPLYTL